MLKPKKELNMKKLFRRNQVIITALAVMIAAAGYLNYAGKQELAAGSQVYEAGMLEISDEDILAENQASPNYGDVRKLPWKVKGTSMPREMLEKKAWRPEPREKGWMFPTGMRTLRKRGWKIQGKLC